MVYETLERHFKVPVRRLSPFYRDSTRIPRKTKKDMKSLLGTYYTNNDNNTRMWCYLKFNNPNYHRFIIKQIVK